MGKEEKEFEQQYGIYTDRAKLQGYIDSLEADNEVIRRAMPTSGSEKRRQKRLLKINEKDIARYKKMLQG